jgi:hypothetical protein
MYTQVRSPEARAAAAKALKTAGQTRIAPPLVPLRIGPPQAGSHPPPPRALIHRRVTPEPSAAASLQPSGSQSPLEKHVMPEGGHRPAQLQDAVTQTDEWLLPAAPEPPPPPARSHDMTQAAESQPQSVPAATEHQPAAAENPVVPGHPLTVAAVQQHVRMLHSASVESFSVLGLSGRVTSTEQLLVRPDLTCYCVLGDECFWGALLCWHHAKTCTNSARHHYHQWPAFICHDLKLHCKVGCCHGCTAGSPPAAAEQCAQQ